MTLRSTTSFKSALMLLFAISNHQPGTVQSFFPNTIASHPQHPSSCSLIIPSSWYHLRFIKDESLSLFVSTDPLNLEATEAKFRQIEDAKTYLIALCESKGTFVDEVRDNVSYLESLQQQSSKGSIDDVMALIQTMNRWMNGEWELIYTPVDITRSSPFFWAFRQAFPDVTDQIYSITDGIPSSIKQVGPAYQNIDCRSSNNVLDDNTSVSGTFVSRVKVAALGGIATSTMTTRASIIGCDNNIEENCCELRIKIETTKPEDSTVLKKLFGEQFGATINDIIPPYPSGETLEQVLPGSSEVVVMTTFCDPTIRITKNKNRPREEFFIWKRKSYNTYETL